MAIHGLISPIIQRPNSPPLGVANHLGKQREQGEQHSPPDNELEFNDSEQEASDAGKQNSSIVDHEIDVFV